MVSPALRRRRTLTLRALFVAVVAVAVLYVAGLTAVITLRIAPNFAMLRRNTVRVLALYDATHTRSQVLVGLRRDLTDLVASAHGRGLPDGGPAALAAIRASLDSAAIEPGWISLVDVPTQLQGALIGEADMGSRLGNQLRLAVAAVELGHFRAADSLLAVAGQLEQVGSVHRVYTERMALLDLVRRERSLSSSAASALRAVALWVVIGVLTGPLLGFLVYRRFYRPLADLDRAISAVAAGDLDTRVPVRRDDELGRLTAHFNDLAGVLRARAEDEHRRAQHLERERIFRLSPDLMATASMDGRFLSVNPAFEKTLGFTAEELREAPFINFVHPDDRETTLAQLVELSRGNPAVMFRNRYRCKDGSYRWLSWDCAPPTDGVLYAVARDVTEQQAAEERQARLQADVERSAREWTLTFDAVDYGILILDADRRVVRANEAARRLCGRPYTAILGLTVGALGEGQPWARAAVMAEALRDGRRTESSQVTDPAGDRTWDIEVMAVPSGAMGEQRVIVVLYEITAMVRLQRSLRHSETMSALGTLVAGVAHEVRNPLFSMTATLDAFEERYGSGETPRHLAVLRSQLTRLTALMQELLEYGKPAALEMGPADLGEVVRQAVESCSALAEERQVSVRTDVSAAVPRVMMDRLRLIQMFANLVTNAIQHSPSGGTVLVEVQLPRADLGELVECTVRDNGPGFAPEDLPRVFEPFYTRRRGGTGLGLALVQRIAEQHGGVVTAGNGLSGGVVIVRLPLRLP